MLLSRFAPKLLRNPLVLCSSAPRGLPLLSILLFYALVPSEQEHKTRGIRAWDKKWFLRIIMIAHFSEECKFHSYSSLERAVRDCSVDLVDWRSRKELPPIIDMYRFLSTLFPLVTSLILRLLGPFKTFRMPFCCFFETTRKLLLPIVATPFLPSGEKLLFRSPLRGSE